MWISIREREDWISDTDEHCYRVASFAVGSVPITMPKIFSFALLIGEYLRGDEEPSLGWGWAGCLDVVEGDFSSRQNPQQVKPLFGSSVILVFGHGHVLGGGAHKCDVFILSEAICRRHPSHSSPLCYPYLPNARVSICIKSLSLSQSGKWLSSIMLWQLNEIVYRVPFLISSTGLSSQVRLDRYSQEILNIMPNLMWGGWVRVASVTNCPVIAVS